MPSVLFTSERTRSSHRSSNTPRGTTWEEEVVKVRGVFGNFGKCGTYVVCGKCGT